VDFELSPLKEQVKLELSNQHARPLRNLPSLLIAH